MLIKPAQDVRGTNWQQQQQFSAPGKESASSAALRKALLAAEADAELLESSEDDVAMEEGPRAAPSPGKDLGDQGVAAADSQPEQQPISLLEGDEAQPAGLEQDPGEEKVEVGGPEDLLPPGVPAHQASCQGGSQGEAAVFGPDTMPAEVKQAINLSDPPEPLQPVPDTKEQPAAEQPAGTMVDDALDRAAAAEEMLRKDMEREAEQQPAAAAAPEAPPSPVQYSKDPWAHEAWSVLWACLGFVMR